ncbi:MAG: carboxypeptidase-like regulatory domain-containing protein [Acidobacteriota bacterium]|nr:carboxypeptidase-like regulatory domain-containing protein [Acidobacteriota bacterium]
MRLLATFFLVLSCNAAVIDGLVVEDETGYPLAWSQVSLIPLAGTKSPALTVRASNRGTFKMPEVPAGWYVLRTSREGFEASEVGQMRPGRPGIPFEVTAAGHNYFQVRMRRMGAITGTVLDRNNVGVPDWPVQVYTGRKPFRRVASGVTDERGVFRIGLLAAGVYVVRSASGTLEDGTGLLPSYYQSGTSFESAQAVRVRVGQTTPDIIIRVLQGRLYEITGSFSSVVPAHLTFLTDGGRVTIATISPRERLAAFGVKDIPPGFTELVAEGADCGTFDRRFLDRDLGGLRISCGAMSVPSFEWAGSSAFPILIRRLDPDLTGPAHSLAGHERLVPGRYEIMPQTGEGFYVESVEKATPRQGWFALDLSNSPSVRIAVSNHPAAISGKVSGAGSPIPGAMVYLQRIDIPQLWTQRAGLDGSFQFNGLAPGTYRALSSFDFDPDDPPAMNAAHIIVLKEADKVSQPLELALP